MPKPPQIIRSRPESSFGSSWSDAVESPMNIDVPRFSWYFHTALGKVGIDSPSRHQDKLHKMSKLQRLKPLSPRGSFMPFEVSIRMLVP